MCVSVWYSPVLRYTPPSVLCMAMYVSVAEGYGVTWEVGEGCGRGGVQLGSWELGAGLREVWTVHHGGWVPVLGVCRGVAGPPQLIGGPHEHGRLDWRGSSGVSSRGGWGKSLVAVPPVHRLAK